MGNLVMVVTYARHIFLAVNPIVIRHAILGAFFVASAVWIALAAIRGGWSTDIRNGLLGSGNRKNPDETATAAKINR
jgi:hypothetical protein